MTERYRRSSGAAKMENEFTPKKTMIIMVIVVACFAVLWPRIFYPMLYGSVNQQIKPSAIDKTTGCCYVLSETDVDAIKIMTELCGKIIKEQMGDIPLTGRQIINVCQDEVYRTCGIDVSAVLQEQVRLGHTTKQILDEIRSLNGSLCLKYNFGVQPWRLGVPHMITLRNVSESVRQERSPLVRSEMVHPAFRERGRAIPQAKPTHPHRIIEGKPGPLPGMRPTLGGPGHVVPPPKQQGSGSMGIIMPIYTIGIVIFFTYTLMKIICKKHPDTDTIYSKMDLDARYLKENLTENGSRGSRDASSCKLVVNAMSALLEEVDQEIEARRKSSEVAQDECTSLSNGSVKKEEKPSVKIMAMETTESCEGGKKWQSANSAVLPAAPQPVSEHVNPPQEIYLDRTLPAQSQILVTDSATETEKNALDDDSPVVLAGKMTLSVISLENEEFEIDDILKVDTEEAIHENNLRIKEEINNIIDEAIETIDHGKDDIEIEKITEDVMQINEGIPMTVACEKLNKETAEASLKNDKDVEDKLICVEAIKQGSGLDTQITEETLLGMDIVEKEDIQTDEKNIHGEENIESEEVEEDASVDVEILEQEELAEEEIKDDSVIIDRKEEKADLINIGIIQKHIQENEEIEDTSRSFESIEKQDDTKEEVKDSICNIISNDEDIVPKETVNSTSTSSDRNDKTVDLYDERETKFVEDGETAPKSLTDESSSLIKTQTIPSDHSSESDPFKSAPGIEKNSCSPMLNLNAKSSSEDSGSTVLSGSNQGSVINVSTRDAENENDEEVEEVSEEESDVEYEEEEIEISEEEEIEENDGERVQLAEIRNQNAASGLVNGAVTHNGAAEDEDSEEEEVVEEIIEEYSDDDEGNWEVNSN